MASLRQGDHRATRQLFDLLYPQLRQLAGIRMRGERKDHSWQPTALVNELYLELIKIKSLKGGQDAEDEKESFFRLAAFLMRRLLIHHSRPLYRRIEKVELENDSPGEIPDSESLLDIENALNRLAEINPNLRCVVEMRVFEGRNVEEIAKELGCSTKTISRYWTFSQRWLREALQ
jgi:RNA polymerase sigma factor (TIGR02999 family)